MKRPMRAERTTTRGLLLAAVALITPAGLVMVNAAAYVMVHLAAFRLAITVSAVLSTAVLNSLTAVALYRLGQTNWADAWLFRDDNRRVVLPTGAALLLLLAAAAGFLTYRGLSDPRRLPNLQTFLAGVVGLVIPLILALMLREDVSRRARRRYRTR